MLRSGPFWYRNFPRITHFVRRIARANYEREMELLDVLCDRARAGVDVGAKVGMYTYRIRRRCSKVIAFEPQPLFNQMLAKVFDGLRGKVHPFALSNRCGHATMRIPWDARARGLFGRSTIEAANTLAYHEIDRTDELEVETRTLDDVDVGDVGFIKIDVEGHELAVLEGATHTLATSRPNLLVECNDEHRPGGPAELARWLAEHDYNAHFMFGARILPIAEWDYDTHWRKHGIENFIGVHESRPEVLAAVEARAHRLIRA
jgi:FkbM family methyltransferase